MKKILIHGSGHKADSWNKVIEYMNNDEDILCPNLDTILNGKEASYTNLYSSFAEYCNKIPKKFNFIIKIKIFCFNVFFFINEYK